MKQPPPFALWIVRALFVLAAVGVGVYASNLTGGSLWMSILAAAGAGSGLVAIELLSARTAPRTVSAICFGLLVGFVGAQLCVVFLTFRGDEFPAESLAVLRVALTAAFCYLAVAILLRTGDQWRMIVPYVEFRRRHVEGDRPILLDTSVLIDGRIQAMSGQHLFDNPLLVPRCVIAELQRLSDAREKTKRSRGRRGLEVLSRLRREGLAEILRSDDAVGEVDARLIALARRHDGKLMSLDGGLVRAAEIEGVTVIDLSAVEKVFRARLIPGEQVEIELVRQGEETGQAVGFLEDGTMVVVGQARERIGDTVSVSITKSLQTAGGRIAFARLDS